MNFRTPGIQNQIGQDYRRFSINSFILGYNFLVYNILFTKPAYPQISDQGFRVVLHFLCRRDWGDHHFVGGGVLWTWLEAMCAWLLLFSLSVASNSLWPHGL